MHAFPVAVFLRHTQKGGGDMLYLNFKGFREAYIIGSFNLICLEKIYHIVLHKWIIKKLYLSEFNMEMFEIDMLNLGALYISINETKEKARKLLQYVKLKIQWLR